MDLNVFICTPMLIITALWMVGVTPETCEDRYIDNYDSCHFAGCRWDVHVGLDDQTQVFFI